MAKVHNIYNQVALFAGIVDSSGYHCIDNNGSFNNFSPSTGNYNLLFPLERTIGTNFSFQVNRTPIKQLGNDNFISRPILNPTELSLNINYNLMGLQNDIILGLLANIPSGDYKTGTMLYGNGRVCPVSGIYNRDSSIKNYSIINYPLKFTDSRNIFAISRKDLLDANNLKTGESLVKNNNNYYTTAFGDCYLTSYETFGSIDQLPQSTAKFIANNIMVYDGVGGYSIPSILTRDQTLNSGYNFYIPNNLEQRNDPTVILPSDINISINNTGSNTSIDNLFFNFSDIKIQSYNIGFQLERDSLYNIGYKYPMDRPINLPILVNLSFETIPGDLKSSSLINLLKEDNLYNISLKLNFQNNTRNFTGTAIQYDFLGAYFDNLDDSLSIQNRERNTFNFTTEMRPDDTTYGFFISGFLGVSPKTGYVFYYNTGNSSLHSILDEFGASLYDEQSNLILEEY